MQMKLTHALLTIIMLTLCSTLAIGQEQNKSTSVKAELGVGGEIMVSGNGVSGKISIGSDTKTGVIGYKFSFHWLTGTGSGVSASEDVSIGTGTYNGGPKADIGGKLKTGNVTLNGSVDSDGKYSMTAEYSSPNGMKGFANISGDDISAGIGAGTSAGTYVVETETGVTFEGTLYDPSKAPESAMDIFWGGVFAPGMAIGEAVATTQIGIEKLIGFFRGFRTPSMPPTDQKPNNPPGQGNGNLETVLPVDAPPNGGSGSIPSQNGGKSVLTPLKPIKVYR